MNLTNRCTAARRRVDAFVEARAAELLEAITKDFARLRVQHRLRPYAIGPSRLLRLPARFECPECGGRVCVEIDEWSTRDGIPTAGGYRTMCEPDTEAEVAAWSRDEDYLDGHRYWQSDWMPLEQRVGRWMVRNVRVVD